MDNNTTPPLQNTQANPPLGEFFTDPAIASHALPLLEYKPEEPKHKNVGNIVTENTIMSYTCTFGKTVSVTARIESEGVWKFEGIINGEKTIEGLVYGGKWKASTYCKFIRNGLLSRSNKGHGTKKESEAS